MDIREPIISQYLSALEMLRQTIQACPAELWFNPQDHNKFSQIAYHTLYWAHAYVQDSEQTFHPWSAHRDDYRLAGGGEPEPHAEPSQALVLEYLAFCQDEILKRVPLLDLEAPSGFDWVPCSKFELQLDSLRHIQHHTAELMERLGWRAGIEIDWITTRAEIGARQNVEAA
jgi:hypothetical protein